MHMTKQPAPRLPPPLLHACAMAVLVLSAGAACAADETYPAWTFGGFGTAGASHSDYDQADFTSSVLKGEGAGATRSVGYSLDSRLGAQLGVKLDKKWSAVVQVITEQRYDLSYRPQVEWANVKYQVTPDLALRVGRIALPIFLAADYRKVGYAYPWARTPTEVYGGVPVTNSDGADIAYRWQHGRVKHTTQAFYGQTHIRLTDTTSAKGHDLGGITHSIEWGPTMLRVGIMTAVLDVNVARQLFDGFSQFGPAGVAIAERFDIVNKRTSGYTLGFSYDPGNWFLMAEGGRISTRSFLGDTIGVYASAGYRAGAFTPYLSYARNDAKSPASDPGLPLAGLPPPYAAAAAQLNSGLDVLLKTTSSQSNLAAGVRWDFRPDMALKLHYEHVTPRDGSRGTLINLQPGFESGRSLNITSVVLDFVF